MMSMAEVDLEPVVAPVALAAAVSPTFISCMIHAMLHRGPRLPFFLFLTLPQCRHRPLPYWSPLRHPRSPSPLGWRHTCGRLGHGSCWPRCRHPQPVHARQMNTKMAKCMYKHYCINH
jgi:hypothetical protein